MSILRRPLSVATTALATLALMAAPAAAHVTVQPTTAPAGEFFRFDVRVPNERDDADTVKIEVDFPDNLTNVSFQPKTGWERTVTMKTLDEPIIVFGEEVTEVIDTVTWEGGTIAPGEFDEFGFSARTPDDPASLVFPSIQTYSSGEEVAWIQIPSEGQTSDDLEEPAPAVTVAAGEEDVRAVGASVLDPLGITPGTAAVTALGLGIVALLLGIASFVRARR